MVFPLVTDIVGGQLAAATNRPQAPRQVPPNSLPEVAAIHVRRHHEVTAGNYLSEAQSKQIPLAHDRLRAGGVSSNPSLKPWNCHREIAVQFVRARSLLSGDDPTGKVGFEPDFCTLYKSRLPDDDRHYPLPLQHSPSEVGDISHDLPVRAQRHSPYFGVAGRKYLLCVQRVVVGCPILKVRPVEYECDCSFDEDFDEVVRSLALI